jgi:hypothetical protein
MNRDTDYSWELPNGKPKKTPRRLHLAECAVTIEHPRKETCQALTVALERDGLRRCKGDF